jgi:predicted phage terminase large subunit-like protein
LLAAGIGGGVAMKAVPKPQPNSAALKRCAKLLAELKKRTAQERQACRGWYNEHGVRQGGLIAFVRYFWRVLEPETKFVDGWPLWAMCEHLEAVTAGEINRLLVTVPPGFCKSLLVDVFWPAWEWGPMDKAHLRYVTFSYSASLTERDNSRFKDLVESREFQALWGDRVEITRAGDVKVSNSAKGWKIASSVGGVATGERGDRILLDDPHNVKEAESEVVRSETVRWFRESMSNRLNDIERGAIVIIMQRVHASDVVGTIFDLNLDYECLMIPMRHDVSRQVDAAGDPKKTRIGWFDPRYDPDLDQCDGILAWPERFPERAVERIKAEIGSFAWASQYQQSPAPRGGGIIKRSWWQLYESPDGKFYPPMEYIVASLDPAFTAKQTNDPSGFVVFGVFTNQERQRRIMLMAAWSKHLELHGEPVERLPGESEFSWQQRARQKWGLIEHVVHSCRRFRAHKLLVESKGPGLSVIQELRRLYGREDFVVQHVDPKSQDKQARVHSIVPQFAQGLIYAPAKDWAESVITECEQFPYGKRDDQVDAVSQALLHLRNCGLARMDAEAKADEIGTVMHRPGRRSIAQHYFS